MKRWSVVKKILEEYRAELNRETRHKFKKDIAVDIGVDLDMLERFTFGSDNISVDFYLSLNNNVKLEKSSIEDNLYGVGKIDEMVKVCKTTKSGSICDKIEEMLQKGKLIKLKDYCTLNDDYDKALDYLSEAALWM